MKKFRKLKSGKKKNSHQQIIPDNMRDAIELLKNCDLDASVSREIIRADNVFPVSAAIAKKHREVIEESRKLSEQLEIGKIEEGRGVFAGHIELTDNDGANLGSFNIYAAPEDIKDEDGNNLLLSFNEAAEHVSDLEGYFGHDGGKYKHDDDLYAAINANNYNGEWFVPPLKILQDVSMFRNKGDLRDSFVQDKDIANNARWYWSSTTHDEFDEAGWNRNIQTGVDSNDVKDLLKLSVRCVRMEPRL
jgi:hypothetical protein